MEFLLRKDQPIYLQLAQTLADAIVRGDLVSGQKLPSQRDIATLARVNPNTVQRAYLELEHWGYTETRRGEGTFVKLRDQEIKELKKETAEKAWKDFIRQLQDAGLTGADAHSWVKTRTELEEW